MKAYFSIVFFVVLLASSVISGMGNYIDARGRIVSELNRALVRALAEKGNEWVTADTIRVCRELQSASATPVAMLLHDKYFSESLSIPELRDKSYISFAVLDDGRESTDVWHDAAGVSGDTVLMKSGLARNVNVAVAFRANADCSFATVFSLSDQKLPFTLCFMAVLWAMFTLRYKRTGRAVEVLNQGHCCVGNLRFDVASRTFYNMENEEVRFTPMQLELMEMFFKSEGHKLDKSEICQMLWPGKDDASETLYTLIRRLKRVVEQNTNLQIEGERGRAYRLIIKSGYSD